MPKNESSITVSPELKEYIQKKQKDYRVNTTCAGPLILPLEMKDNKPTDIVINVGDQKLYISAVQARFVKHVDLSMLCKCVME